MNAIQQMALHYMETKPNGLDLLSSDERYSHGKGNICQLMNMALKEAGFVKDADRLGFVSNLVGRPINSTKELHFGEAWAIYRGRDMLKKAGTQ